jgi:hypothetical protein
MADQRISSANSDGFLTFFTICISVKEIFFFFFTIIGFLAFSVESVSDAYMFHFKN